VNSKIFDSRPLTSYAPAMQFIFPHRELPALDVADHIRRKRDTDIEALIDGYLPLALNIMLSQSGGNLLNLYRL